MRVMQGKIGQFFKDLVESKMFVLEFVEMEKQLVETFTKILIFDRLDSLRKTLVLYGK